MVGSPVDRHPDGGQPSAINRQGRRWRSALGKARAPMPASKWLGEGTDGGQQMTRAGRHGGR